MYLTFNPGKRSAELREGPNEGSICATSLLSVLGLIRCFLLLEEVGGSIDLDKRMPNEACLNS